MALTRRIPRWETPAFVIWEGRAYPPFALFMSEQRPKENEASSGRPPASALEPPPSATELFLDSGVSDEAPTIISKSPPAPARSEEIFNSGLRGRHLAHFELIEPIGVGGMAAVIRARDTQLDRIVALKILPPEMATDAENVRRFHQEARAAAKLDHENIARVFFGGEDQRLHFIAFEFVEGDNLRAVLERRGRLPVTEAVNYVLQIAMGLAHAAGRGVVHRDIKPSNIIITPTGRAKLVDMGLARHLGHHDNRALTQSGVTLGTFDYISPEQALEPRDADVRSDIYSLGCTFYHMLTGQPPVPEGTAAKKLHHHQHLAPVDPRQLNPDVPDSVAAILARMMAKSPRDRYQRAEHLVMHLIQVAQKIGAPAEVPESLLFVDAPLPSAPRRRPVLLASVGLLALSVLLLALSLAPKERDLSRPRWADGRPAGKDARETIEEKAATVAVEQVKPRLRNTQTVRDVKGLADALKDPSVTKILLEEDLDLSEEKDLRWEGRRLTIESSDPLRPRILTVAYHRAMDGNTYWAGLTFSGGEASVEGVHFKIRANEIPPMLLAGVALERGGKLTMKKCLFDQETLPKALLIADARSPARIASVYVDNSSDESSERPTLVFDECRFIRGQDAILLAGNARVELNECPFGPHAADFHLVGRGAVWQTEVKLRHCSLFVVNGPMLRLDGDATCKFSAQQTVFSGEQGASSAAESHLFWQTASTDRAVRYQGKTNAFYKVNSYWVRSAEKSSDPDQFTDWKEFRKEVVLAGGSDDGSRVLDKNPWQSDRPLEEISLRERFRLDLTLVRDWLKETGEVLGVRRTAGGEVLYTSADLQTVNVRPPDLVREPNVKIVDPAAKVSEGVYHSLAEAVQGAEKGDVILLKHTGKMKLNAVPSTQSDLNLTIKPYPGYHPVLTLAESTLDEEAALFRLYHGQLKFENLEFYLRPDRGDFASQTIVSMAGNGRCTFKQCVITLESAFREVRLSAVTLLDSKGVMKMPPKAEGRIAPEVVLRNCFVRGQGGLLAGRANRPYDLDVSNSLVALDGSLLDADGTLREGTMPDRGAQIRLSKVTTYLTEHLLHLYGSKAMKGFLSTRVESASDCLFTSPQGKALVHLESLDSEEQMRRHFAWKGEKNAYSGFDKMIEMQPAEGEVVMRRFDQDDWQKFANVLDVNALFLKQKLDFSPVEERPLAQVLPEEFRQIVNARQELAGAGAPLETLPRPWGAKETNRPSEVDAQ
jgi:serine/threonine protein kinase